MMLPPYIPRIALSSCCGSWARGVEAGLADACKSDIDFAVVSIQSLNIDLMLSDCEA